MSRMDDDELLPFHDEPPVFTPAKILALSEAFDCMGRAQELGMSLEDMIELDRRFKEAYILLDEPKEEPRWDLN